jgi:uncharacterized protein (DUF305 family)
VNKHFVPVSCRRGVAAALLLALLAAACGPRTKPATPYDLQFIDAMVLHHQGAIDMALPADTNALHPELRQFARGVIEAQSGEIAQMKQWREQWFAGRPSSPETRSMPGMAMSMMDISPDHMHKLRGVEFDRMFIEMMIPHHEGAIAMARDALVRAQHEEIRQLAQRIIADQQAEIETLNRWKTEWAK